MANKKLTSKKVASNNSSLLENMKKKWWAVLLLALFLLVVGSFAYSKYLDYKNVQDMKALLADFQELEKNIGEKLGEKIKIDFECRYYGEKFNERENCFLTIPNASTNKLLYSDLFKSSVLSSSERCRLSVDGQKIGSVVCYISPNEAKHKDIEILINNIIT